MIRYLIIILGVLGMTHVKASSETQVATFAGGCFWCVEHVFQEMPGVLDAVSGYGGGTEENPTYDAVSSKKTGHVEAVQVTFNPSVVTYAELLDLFWHNIDPTQLNGQFCDLGSQYRSIIFYHTMEQKELAEASKEALVQSDHFDKSIVTEVAAFTTFYPAEEHHQDYHKRNPFRYNTYTFFCGRAQQLAIIWSKFKEKRKEENDR